MFQAFSKSFSELSLDELYDILRVRAEIFVVGQRCFYLDPDGLDKTAVHVGIRDGAGALAAYARMFPEEAESGVWHVGRVLAVRRGEGLGRRVMEEVERAAALRGARLLRMEA
ncbi:MAG: GNAT family N-acetyltransferase, partial [Kiritimatiellae bacterium]|nr:GNAT family N-acetyltransferase [Kiritimatiellia bacterium]